MKSMTEQAIKAYLTGKLGGELVIYNTIDSTNNAAKLLAKNGAPHGAAVLARQQTAGKGRLGRSFHSPDGAGIYMTVILRPQLPAEQSLLVTAAAAVAVSRAVAEVSGLETQIKWVNDIYLNGKKLCGILAESALGEGGRLEYIVLGIGINVYASSFPPELAEIAISLEQAGSGELDADRLAAAVLNHLSTVYDQLETREFLAEYKTRSCVLGKTVQMHCGDRSQEVTVLDINGDGNLIVSTGDGQMITLATGEITLKGDWR